MKVKGHTIQDACSSFQKSRQGYYHQFKYDKQRKRFNKAVIEKVRQIRAKLPLCGTRKLYYLLKQEGIGIGRDRLFTLLRNEKMLIKKKRKYINTTHSEDQAVSYNNLLKELEIKQAEQVFVSDITYIRLQTGFCYLAIVADGYSKKIMGKFLSRDLQTSLVLKALTEALKQRKDTTRLIHHSDHGSQYSSRNYINALKLSNMMISMAGRGKAWENPVAERILGILKHEFGLLQTFKNYQQASKTVDDAILKYNTIRPHLSCGYLTPDQAHDKGKNLENMWQKKISTFPQKEQRKKEAKKEKRKITTTNTVKYI